MKSRFELFIANRYLRAHRKEAAVSIITWISVIGVAAGVMALVIALAVNNGFKNTLERNLLGAMAHINVMERNPTYGIENWREMSDRLRKVPHVTAVSPALYAEVFLSGSIRGRGAVLKGVDIDAELRTSEALTHLKSGSLVRLRDPNAKPPGILVGARLVEQTGMEVGSQITVVSPNEGELTPFGTRPAMRRFVVSGIYETGFYDIDNLWAYASIDAVQSALSLPSVVNAIELKLDDLNLAPQVAKDVQKLVGNRYTTTTWMEQNGQLLNALKMERIVTIITIGLIQLVAALNIFITLVMMVMEKYRDIAVLMSMGAKPAQVRRIFMLQGVLIGVAGSIIGLITGYTLCYFADKYRWIKLPEEVYSMSFVPFNPRPLDAIWIAAAAILVSFIATIYPARNATRIAPAEVLRYE